MKIGLRLPQTGKNRATRENIIHFTQEAEDAGFDSLRVLERLICLLIHKMLIPKLKMESSLKAGNMYLIHWSRIILNNSSYYDLQYQGRIMHH
jgi:hypothetical protein